MSFAASDPRSRTRYAIWMGLIAPFIFWSAMSWAQTASQTGNGRVAQYTITVSEGSAILQPGNAFSGSVPAEKPTPEVLPLSLKDAINRGLKQNLGLLLSGEGILS